MVCICVYDGFCVSEYVGVWLHIRACAWKQKPEIDVGNYPRWLSHLIR